MAALVLVRVATGAVRRPERALLHRAARGGSVGIRSAMEAGMARRRQFFLADTPRARAPPARAEEAWAGDDGTPTTTAADGPPHNALRAAVGRVAERGGARGGTCGGTRGEAVLDGHGTSYL